MLTHRFLTIKMVTQSIFFKKFKIWTRFRSNLGDIRECVTHVAALYRRNDLDFWRIEVCCVAGARSCHPNQTTSIDVRQHSFFVQFLLYIFVPESGSYLASFFRIIPVCPVCVFPYGAIKFSHSYSPIYLHSGGSNRKNSLGFQSESRK